MKSLVFTERLAPAVVTPDARILSVALHAICALACASREIAEGKKDQEAAMRSFSATVSQHLINLFPNSSDAVRELMLCAHQHGLVLCPDLGPIDSFKEVVH